MIFCRLRVSGRLVRAEPLKSPDVFFAGTSTVFAGTSTVFACVVTFLVGLFVSGPSAGFVFAAFSIFFPVVRDALADFADGEVFPGDTAGGVPDRLALAFEITRRSGCSAAGRSAGTGRFAVAGLAASGSGERVPASNGGRPC